MKVFQTRRLGLGRVSYQMTAWTFYSSDELECANCMKCRLLKDTLTGFNSH